MAATRGTTIASITGMVTASVFPSSDFFQTHRLSGLLSPLFWKTGFVPSPPTSGIQIPDGTGVWWKRAEGKKGGVTARTAAAPSPTRDMGV